MGPKLPLLVFSDLDGTLLDHQNYSFDAARPALQELKRHGAGVILASSKTGAEIAPIRDAMELSDWPAIVENGGGILWPKGAIETSADYLRIRNWLRSLPPALQACFTGFGDMSAQQVVDVTGLPLESARLAKSRVFTEPGLWSGSDETLDLFLDHAARAGMTAKRGGRFLTLGFGATKADRMGELIREYAPGQTVALGDAPNDVEMINAADIGVIVKNPHAPVLPKMPKETAGRIIRTQEIGPIGWNRAILSILSRENPQH